MKICTKCGSSENGFYKEKKGKDGFRTLCKECDKLKTKKQFYGLSVEAFMALKAKHNNACAICKKPESETIMCVDHCHTSGKIRGILCAKCNSAIGFMFDSVEILQKAIDYLKDSK